MTNPVNQLPFYASDTIAPANSSYVCLPSGNTPAEIERNQVVVKEENRGDEGSKKFTSNYTAATEALKPGFGAAKHFARMVRRLMLVRSIIPISKDSFVAT